MPAVDYEYSYTREVANPYSPYINNLIQLPIKFDQSCVRSQGENPRGKHFTQVLPTLELEGRALYDTGASDSFISAKRVKELNLPIQSHRVVVKNGDGSYQVSPGYVTVTFSMGTRWKATARFRVVELKHFDLIIGLPMINHFRMELRMDPYLKIVASCPSHGRFVARRVTLPMCVLARQDAEGRDTSAYVCDEQEFTTACKQFGWTREDALVACNDDADVFSHALLMQELTDLASSTSATEFEHLAHTLLSDLAGVSEAPSGAGGESDVDTPPNPDQVSSSAAAKFTAPTAHRFAETEMKFREDLVAKYPDLCADTLPPEGPSATLPDGTPYKVKLVLKPGMVPQGRRQFRIPEAYREELINTINDLLKFKLIEPTISPYSNPVMLVPKPPRKDGSYAGLRFVWDGRGVNKALESDAYLIPRVEELVDRIARLKYEAEKNGVTQLIFSGLDQRTSFWQIALEEGSRDVTAFSTSQGQFRWTVLPMGMVNSSAHLQRFTETLLRPFSVSNTFQYTNSKGELVTGYGTAVGYIDDIGVITFGDVEAHAALLWKVLGAMNTARLRIQPAKCEFFRERGEFLGHVLTSEGIAAQENKLNAIKDWPPLSDLKSVRAFVSLCSYYRKFVKDFAEIAQPLTDLMKKDAFKTPIPEDAVQAYEKLKEALTSAPVLKYFDVNRPTELYVDACDNSIGAVLMQQHDGGNWHPVGYYSRRLHGAETGYATYYKELLGLRDGVLHFRHWLLGVRFKVRTDHCSLRWLMSQSELSGQQQRWLAVLQQFQMEEIVHVPGVQNVVADVLSRYPDPNGPSYEHLLPEHGNMDVRFNHLWAVTDAEESGETTRMFSHLEVEEQRVVEALLRGAVEPNELPRFDVVESQELLHNGVTEPIPPSTPSLLPAPTQLFADTPQDNSISPDEAPNVCRFCRKPDCTSFCEEFARHSVQPVKMEDMRANLQTEEGFPEASVVSADTDIANFVKSYETCDDFMQIYQAVKDLEEGKQHATYPQYFVRKNGLLMFKDGASDRVCVPSGQRNLILKVMHDSPLGMHRSFAKTLVAMSSRFYFPQMAQRVRIYCETCEKCQRNKPWTANARGQPVPLPVPQQRFDAVALDIVSGFPTTKAGYDAIVVFTDRLTKRAWIEPCTKTASARDLALIFFRSVFRSQGMPKILLSDRGPQFVSTFWKEFFGLLKTDIRLTSSYHPQSNGGSERFNRTLIEALRSYVTTRHNDWDEHLVHLEFAYNSSVNPATGLTPFDSMYAQQPRAPWDLLRDQGGDVMAQDFDSDVARSLGMNVLANLRKARDAMHAAAQDLRERNARLSNPHEYKVGDPVLLSTQNVALKHVSRKLAPRYIGPFKIVKLLGQNAVEIEPTGRFKALDPIINVEYLRPYKERTENVGPPPSHLSVKPIVVEPAGDWYQIADIQNHRGPPGPRQDCLVRWEGFDASHDSWVRRDSITPAALISYEEFLVECAKDNKQKSKEYLRTFIGNSGEFSEIKKAERRKQRADDKKDSKRNAPQPLPRSAPNVDQASSGNRADVRRSSRLAR